MNPAVAFPFLRLSDPSVEASAWKVGMNGADPVPCTDHLPNWDPSCHLLLTRTVRVDHELSARLLGLEATDCHLMLDVRVGTGSGRLPRSIIHREARLVGSAGEDICLEFELAGHSLSTVIDLVTNITLHASPTSPGELSPGKAGDRVWDDDLRIRIEGEEPRLPIEVVDLDEVVPGGLASSAPWYLHWSPSDGTRDFHGAIRLYLNSRTPETVRRVEEEDPQTLQSIMADIMGQVCERLVAEDDEEGDPGLAQYEQGTLGFQARAWLEQAWPGKDLTFLRGQLRRRPGQFRATFLALAQQRDV